MILCSDFVTWLQENGCDLCSGVPDSLLSAFSAYLLEEQKESPVQHMITANEGNAVALAAGHYMATGKIPLVYMQNSGVGNIVNPVASLIHKDVYQIPMLFLVGWRGEPGTSDEPQHKFQGRITKDLLELMEIKTVVLDPKPDIAKQQVEAAFTYMKKTGQPYALQVKKGTFYNSEEISWNTHRENLPLREEVVETIVSQISSEIPVISTTGKCSRELFEIREKRGESHDQDFLTVGSMGHASSIALGIAQNRNGAVVCLDGDGAAIMHMGAMAILGASSCGNLLHIVLNNSAHESVGGQPTVGDKIHFPQIAAACGYEICGSVDTLAQLKQFFTQWNNNVMTLQHPAFLEIKIRTGSRADLGRPTRTPIENKEGFMDFLRKTEN